MKKLLIIWIGILAMISIGSASHAAGILTPMGSKHTPIRIRDHQVNVTINNGFAMTEVIQTFYNPNPEDLEAVYSFPLPKSASLSEVTVYVGEQEIHGEVVEKEKARTIYNQEKQSGNNAGLGEKNEFYTFEFRVFPVTANAETRIRFLYYQPLKIDTGVGRYLYPLEDGGTDEAGASFWSTNTKVDNTLSVNLELKSAFPIQDVRVPGFEAAAVIDRRGDGHIALSMQLTDTSLSRDFIFYYRLQDGLPGRIEMIPYRDDTSEPGTFMMVITPAEDLKPLDHGADYCFVLDLSGSMRGKLHTLQAGVKKALSKLQAGDRFRLVTFSDSAREITRGWMDISTESIQKAETMIDAMTADGSTNLYDGISLALDRLDDDRATNLVLVTDAVTNTGVVEPKAFYELLRKYDIRVFGFLLGNSANWPLMQTIAESSGGYYDTISNADDILGKMLLAGSKIKYQALLNAEVNISGVKTYDRTDGVFRKVYRGEQLVLFGKYQGSGKARITLAANLTGEDKTYTTEVVFPDKDTDNPELERLWALAYIEKIEAMERISKMPPSESENAIRDLGTGYQIVTDYTSMLVLSDTGFERHGIDRKNRERIAREQQARARRVQQPTKRYRVDRQKPAFKFKLPSVGGGAIDPFSGILIFLSSALGIHRLTRRNRKNLT